MPHFRLQSLAVALALVPVVALAQQASEAEPPIESVTITGSRIARPELDQLQPTLSVGTQQFEERGYANVIDALNELPAFGTPASSKTGSQPSSFGVAQSFADFFSLGSQRTLTLVNGQRFVSSNTASIFGPTDSGQQVDLNAIPTKLIERVDVIAVGGAPIYGSDAIAGTVNVILKRDFEGLEIDGLSGISDRGDAFNWRGRILGGANFASGRGNVTASAEYTKSKGLVYPDRQATAAGVFFSAPADPDSPFNNVLIRDRRIGVVNQGGIPMIADSIPQFAGILDADGNTLQFAPNGQLVPYDFGEATGSIVNNIGGDGLDLNTVSNLLAPTERALFTTLVSFDLTDNVRAFGEGWFSNTRGTRLIDQPVYNSALFGSAADLSGNLTISIDNPFLSATDRATILDNLLAADDPSDPDDGVDPTQFLLARANSDLQSGAAKSESNLYRFVAGVEGDVEFGGRTLTWQVAGNYGHSKGESEEPSVVQQNFENALNAVRDPATGNIVCAASLTPGGVVSSPIETFSDTCAPLNVFGREAPSQEARDYITHLAATTSTITQRVFTANVSSEIITLPAGPLTAVLGYENRRETSKFEPDEFFRLGLGRSIPIDPISGEFETDEFFTEVLVPIIGEEQDIPFVHQLQFEGAARYVDHSIAGGDTTWTTGLRFAPVQDVQFRGNVTRAIRSPAITEAFNPTSQAFDTADDPCDSRFLDSGPNPAQRRANCAAEGIPADFTSTIVDATAEISVSGNPNLLNELADSHTYGVVLRPRWVPRLSLAIDWIRIELTDAIVTLNAESTLEACYDSPDPSGSAQCAAIDRDPTSKQVDFVRTGFANAGAKDFEGYTAQLNYDLPVPALFGYESGELGNLGVRLNYFKLKELQTRVGLGDIDNEAGEIGNSKDQAVLSLTYARGPFSFLWETQYLSDAKWDVDELAGTRDVSGVGDWWRFNSTLGYQFDDHLTVRAIVNNVFDRGPPFPIPAASANSVPTYFEGIFGRSYSLSANYRF